MWPLWYFAIDTSLFKVSNKTYKEYLYDAKNDITIENKKCIENIFYDRLRNKKVQFWKLKVLPKKDGHWDSWFYEKWYHHVLLFFWLWNEWTIISNHIDGLIYNKSKKIWNIKRLLKFLKLKI